MTDDIDLEALDSDMKKLRADLAKLTDTVSSLARKGGSEALGIGRRLVGDIGDEFQEHKRQVTEAIEDKPVAASMIAFGVGVLLGAIFTGSRR